MPPSRKGGILELLDRIEAYVIRHGKLPAALYLELRQAAVEQGPAPFTSSPMRPFPGDEESA